MELFEHHMCTKSSRGRRTTRCRTTLFLAPGQELSRVLSRGKESCQCYINQLLGTLHPEASPHPWCFVEYFLHVPPAVGLILQLLCSPIDNQNFQKKRKHHDQHFQAIRALTIPCCVMAPEWGDASDCIYMYVLNGTVHTAYSAIGYSAKSDIVPTRRDFISTNRQ